MPRGGPRHPHSPRGHPWCHPRCPRSPSRPPRPPRYRPRYPSRYSRCPLPVPPISPYPPPVPPCSGRAPPAPPHHPRGLRGCAEPWPRGVPGGSEGHRGAPGLGWGRAARSRIHRSGSRPASCAWFGFTKGFTPLKVASPARQLRLLAQKPRGSSLRCGVSTGIKEWPCHCCESLHTLQAHTALCVPVRGSTPIPAHLDYPHRAHGSRGWSHAPER